MTEATVAARVSPARARGMRDVMIPLATARRCAARNVELIRVAAGLARFEPRAGRLVFVTPDRDGVDRDACPSPLWFPPPLWFAPWVPDDDDVGADVARWWPGRLIDLALQTELGLPGALPRTSPLFRALSTDVAYARLVEEADAVNAVADYFHDKMGDADGWWVACLAQQTLRSAAQLVRATPGRRKGTP